MGCSCVPPRICTSTTFHCSAPLPASLSSVHLLAFEALVRLSEVRDWRRVQIEIIRRRLRLPPLFKRDNKLTLHIAKASATLVQ